MHDARLLLILTLVPLIIQLSCSQGSGEGASDERGPLDAGGEETTVSADGDPSEQKDDSAADIGEDVAADSRISRYEEVDPAVGAALQALLDEHVLFSADPGMTLSIVTDDGKFWSGAAGVADLKSKIKMTPETGFRVGSNTKPFVATIILQLVDEGLVGLDDDVTEFFPQYGQWAGVTVRHLLSMRSGIVDYLTVAEFMLETISKPGEEISPEEVLAYVTETPLEFEPGTGGQYSNSGYLLLGMIIEQATGNTVADSGETTICFSAVTRLGSMSRIHVCDSGSFMPEAGSKLKLLASLAVETDPVKVEETLSALSIPLCLCIDASGKMIDCE